MEKKKKLLQNVTPDRKKLMAFTCLNRRRTTEKLVFSSPKTFLGGQMTTTFLRSLIAYNLRTLHAPRKRDVMTPRDKAPSLHYSRRLKIASSIDSGLHWHCYCLRVSLVSHVVHNSFRLHDNKAHDSSFFLQNPAPFPGHGSSLKSFAWPAPRDVLQARNRARLTDRHMAERARERGGGTASQRRRAPATTATDFLGCKEKEGRMQSQVLLVRSRRRGGKRR